MLKMPCIYCCVKLYAGSEIEREMMMNPDLPWPDFHPHTLNISQWAQCYSAKAASGMQLGCMILIYEDMPQQHFNRTMLLMK